MHLALPNDTIDVWQFSTADTGIPFAALESFLSEEERDRANRFRLPQLRRDFILSRGSLRVLCSRYLSADPASLHFRYQPNGKPELSEDCPLRFNLSHSGGLTLFAFASDLEVGVDVERIRPIRDIEAIANRFFCPAEAAQVLSAPDDRRPLVFHTCWTRKEAFIKATGDGLSAALNSFEVPLDPAAPFCLVHVNFDRNEGARWTMQSLDLCAPYVGALCYRGFPRSIRLLTYPPSGSPHKLG